jgi:molybdopterin synthase catalytic subunit
VQVRVRLFAAAREIVGQGELAIELKEGSTVGDLMEGIFGRYPGLRGMAEALVFAVNRELAERSMGLQDGDEVGVIPPVSGGTDV